MRLPVNHALPLAALVLLSGCGEGARPAPAAPLSANGPAADYPVVIGAPFTVAGQTHTPEDKLNYDAVGHAAASAEPAAGVWAAHKTLPLPSYAEVTSLITGKTILVRVTRRGPMDNATLIELSPDAVAQLGMSGRVPVRVRRVNPPEPERALLRAGSRAPERMDTPQALLTVLMRKLGAPVGASPPTPAPAAPGPIPTGASKAPRPASVSTPAPAPAPTPAPRAARTAGLVVQIAAFSTRERAEAAARKLGAQVSPAGRLWRMRMGPFASPGEAQAALAKARSAGYSDARIQRAD